MSHNPEVNRHHRKLQWETEAQAKAAVESLKSAGLAGDDPERLVWYSCGDHWHTGHLKKRKK